MRRRSRHESRCGEYGVGKLQHGCCRDSAAHRQPVLSGAAGHTGKRRRLFVRRRIARADGRDGSASGVGVSHGERRSSSWSGQGAVDGFGRLVAWGTVRIPAAVRSLRQRVPRHLQPESIEPHGRSARAVAGRKRRRPDHVGLFPSGIAGARGAAALRIPEGASFDAVADRGRAEHSQGLRSFFTRPRFRADRSLLVRRAVASERGHRS